VLDYGYYECVIVSKEIDKLQELGINQAVIGLHRIPITFYYE
jgi:hypothetical protein